MKDHPIILFDGVCNFCNNTVNFILGQDKKQRFRFAALQSEAGQQLLNAYQLSQQDFDTFIFIEKQQAYLASTAALLLLKHLPWYWQWAQIFWLVPRFIRDNLYRFIARNRYRWFGKREVCMIPGEEIRSRFLQ